MKDQLSRTSWLAGSAAAAASAIIIRPRRTDAQGLIPITVGAGLIESHAEAYYAADQGIFRKHGLDAQVQSFQGGAAVAAAVVGGSIQFGVSNTLQLAQAHAHNIPFKIVAYGNIIEARLQMSALLVSKTSGITNVKDLSGKIVGVSTLRGLDQLGASTQIDKHGGDSKSVQFVEISVAEMGAALLQGRVAAATFSPPQQQQALATNQFISLGDYMGSVAPVWVATNWFSTSNYLQKNPDAARRFAASIYEAGIWAMANRAAASSIIDKVLKTSGSQTFLVFAANGSTSTLSSQLQPVLDVAAHYGYVEPTKGVDLLWNGS